VPVAEWWWGAHILSNVFCCRKRKKGRKRPMLGRNLHFETFLPTVFTHCPFSLFHWLLACINTQTARFGYLCHNRDQKVNLWWLEECRDNIKSDKYKESCSCTPQGNYWQIDTYGVSNNKFAKHKRYSMVVIIIHCYVVLTVFTPI